MVHSRVHLTMAHEFTKRIRNFNSIGNCECEYVCGPCECVRVEMAMSYHIHNNCIGRPIDSIHNTTMLIQLLELQLDNYIKFSGIFRKWIW